MALLEAQAAGVPVISCAVRGVPEVVEHGRTGLLAPAGDERALAGLVRELLLDEGGRLRMSTAAVRFAARERSIDSAAARLGSVLARFTATPA
jgi:glycosyltransferase involved in cell wall biosynthesis